MSILKHKFTKSFKKSVKINLVYLLCCQISRLFVYLFLFLQFFRLTGHEILPEVVLEDSGVFGIENLVTKLDDNGTCKLVQTGDLNRVEGLRPFGKDKLLWLRYACLLQGCDYYPSGLNGIGLKTVVKMLTSL